MTPQNNAKRRAHRRYRGVAIYRDTQPLQGDNMLKKIQAMLRQPSIQNKIDGIINCGEPQPLIDMVLFAEWLDQKHKRGYVVYWSHVMGGMFQVATFDAWLKMEGQSWIGPVHWRTSSCGDN